MTDLFLQYWCKLCLSGFIIFLHTHTYRHIHTLHTHYIHTHTTHYKHYMHCTHAHTHTHTTHTYTYTTHTYTPTHTLYTHTLWRQWLHVGVAFA